ncbi:hypothetical protein LDG_6755 [Legionella drancourtii LLAP12]|uniref:Uncharacterized protein n=1 Tax=Legionella drancourtii LLAP12 TaxID=658187 RepID=G9END3_9GAMM|nr:hypothetical protein LDG_6755 [Legionella drancourtii LLAP12]
MLRKKSFLQIYLKINQDRLQTRIIYGDFFLLNFLEERKAKVTLALHIT